MKHAAAQTIILRDGIAYKFYDDEYETRLKNIEWSMGRTGILTPVAIYEPVDIDGTECSRANLHNISIMKEQLYQPYKGQRIWIYKANQIIPQISNKEWIANEYNPPFNTFNIPNVCPICGGETIVKEDNDSEVLYCANPKCEGKLVNKLENFVGKKGLDIKGLSKATLEKLIDWEWVDTFESIFCLQLYRDKWIKKSGFGIASVDKILNAIEESKKTTLDKVIAAAGIPLIGSTVAKQLAQLENGSYMAFREDVEAELDWTQFDGIGNVMCNTINNFDYTELDNVINYLDLEIKEQKEGLINPFEGKTFCITGKLKIFKNRAELTADIESKGGKVVSSISKKVDYLINNDESSTSAKANQAKALNIKVLTEEEYISII